MLDGDELPAFWPGVAIHAADDNLPHDRSSRRHLRSDVFRQDPLKRSEPFLHGLPRRTHERLNGLLAATRTSEGAYEDALAPAPPGATSADAERALGEHLAAMATAVAVGLLATLTVPLIWFAPAWLEFCGLEPGLLALGEGYTQPMALTLIPMLSPQGWDYVFLVATPAVMLVVANLASLPRGLRAACVVALLTVGFSLFDVMGRVRYARFMALSLITLCFLVIVAALTSLVGHGVVVVRDDIAYTARLAHAARGVGAPMRCSPGGTYLITGGTGALGRAVARHLRAGRSS